MKAKLRPEDVHSKQLSWLCIKPMLVSVRGRDMAAKTEIYRKLHEGQQALFLFYSYHNHTKSLAEFYWFSAYNIIEIKSWNGIKKGMHFFHRFRNIVGVCAAAYSEIRGSGNLDQIIRIRFNVCTLKMEEKHGWDISWS